MATRLEERRLHRSRRDRIIFGVAGGLGEYFDIDPVIVRLAFVLITLAGGAGVLAYIILAIVLPDEGSASAGGQAVVRRNLESLRDDVNTLAGDVRAGLSGAPPEGEMTETNGRARRGRELGALILIGLGLFFLAGNFGWFDWFRWNLFWPVILIILGLVILLRRSS